MYQFLISGSTGLLGSTFRYAFESSNTDYFAVRRDIRTSGILPCAPRKCTFLHCSANTNVDFCELNPDSSFHDNVYLTKYHLLNCPEHVKFVYFSSTGVYGNYQDAPYTESCSCHPTTVHHRHKLAAEKLVLERPNSLVIRIGWLFGDFRKKKNDFVHKRVRELLEQSANKYFHCDNFQHGNPCYTLDVVKSVLALISQDRSGVYNLVNPFPTTRMLYIRHIASLLPLNVSVVPLEEFFSRPAPVSMNESALNYSFNQLGLNSMPVWQESLENYFTSHLSHYLK